LSKRLPILGITASTAPEELSMCRDAGMDDCFVKPTRLVTLKDHLNRWRPVESAPPPPLTPPPVKLDLIVRKTKRSAGIDALATPPGDEVDLDYMTQLWGNTETVKALLDAFVSSFRDDLDTLRPLLEQGSVERLREWHHRVIGAASVLQYQPLLEALDGFRRGLSEKSPAQRREDGVALIARCEVLLERIGAQCASLA
jgi:two-component system sensor histidine kinase EvgS